MNSYKDIENALKLNDNKTVTVYISMLIAFVISYIICIILFNIRCNFLRYKDDTVRKQRCFCITFVFFVCIFILIELYRKCN